MQRCPPTLESSQPIPEAVDELSCKERLLRDKNGKLTAYERCLEKILDRALPAEKVDEWGFFLSRKERKTIQREAEGQKRIAAEKRVRVEAIKNNRKYMNPFHLAFLIRHSQRDELSWTHYRPALQKRTMVA